MLNYNLASCEAASKLIRLCEAYKNKMEVDVIHERYVIDGCSLLGVHSLIGKIVSLNPQLTDKELLQQFSNDLENIK